MLNVKLSDKQNKSVLSLALATVYRPPGPYTDFLSDLLVNVDKALIVGDFNIHVDNTVRRDPAGTIQWRQSFRG